MKPTRLVFISIAILILLGFTFLAAGLTLPVRADGEPPTPYASVRFLPVISFIPTPSPTPVPTVFYVAADGSDYNPGTLTSPWRTIQKAANRLEPGDTVYVRGGVYSEAVTLRVSGSASGGMITFQNYPGETPILDGTDITVPADDNGLFLIVDQSYLVIKGFELRDYRSSVTDVVPVGIHVRGTSHNIEVRNNRVHAIETNVKSSSGGDAHGIAVYGTSAAQPIHDIVIDGNELYDLKLGSSEALVLNGNVENFQVTNNRVHDSNNIGIDLIGFEGTAPDVSVDQARNGLVAGNTVYNIDSYGNPAYGTDQSADGIYVDGGRDIIIERNIVHDADLGMEVTSEHHNRFASGVIVRSNFIYNNLVTGLSIGGYDTARGRTEACTFINNTFYNNDTLQTGSGEFMFQYDTRSNTIENNIFFAGPQDILISNPFTQNTGNTLDYNLYYTVAGPNSSAWEWKTNTYDSFTGYRSATGNDAHSVFVDPKFININAGSLDLHLAAGSPAIDAGSNLANDGDLDIDVQPRIVNSRVDLGADETQ